jgi:hypothetical protein
LVERSASLARTRRVSDLSDCCAVKPIWFYLSRWVWIKKQKAAPDGAAFGMSAGKPFDQPTISSGLKK